MASPFASIRRALLGVLLGLGLAGSVQAASPWIVVAFGDSTTAPREGVEVYASQLSGRFADSSTSVQFVNKGVPGDNTNGASARLLADVLSLHPDLVIIQFGINDSVIDIWKVPPATTARVELPQFEKNLRYLITEIQRQGAKVILMTPNLLRWAPVTQEKYHLPPYDISDELSFARPLVPYAETVRKIAVELRIPLVDVDRAYGEWEQAHHRPCAQLMIDGMHPNTDGHALVAAALAPLLVDQLGLRVTAAGKSLGAP